MDFYSASFSGGKDSTAMVLLLIKNHYPLDEVVFYDTGMEFSAIYNVVNYMERLCKRRGISFVRLYPQRPFLYDMLEKPVRHRSGSVTLGYAWCGGAVRWGTSEKVRLLDKHHREICALHKCNNIYIYVGIAADEKRRVKSDTACSGLVKLYPLIDLGYTEKMCLELCRKYNIRWLEYSVSGAIDLYDVLDRVSCWCCRNKNLKELKAIYRYLPDYWDKLRMLQTKIDMPFKPNASIFDLEQRFESESE